MEFYYVEYVLADVLSEVERKRISLRAAMTDYFKKHRELEPIKGLARAYALGLLRRYKLVDFIAEEVLGVKMERLNLWERNLLRALIYELKFRDIELDRILRVSRKLSSVKLNIDDFRAVRRTSIKSLLKRKQGLERLSIKYSQPRWVVEYLFKILGRKEVIKLFKKFNEKPAIWIRANTLKISRRKLSDILRRRGLKVLEDKDLSDVLRVDTSMNLSRIPEYKLGLFYVQDKASVLAGHVLSPKPGEYVLDMCVAPGSKALHMATLSKNKSLIIGLDWKPARLRTLLESAKKLGVYSVLVLAADSRVFTPPMKFDKILLDPDCTSLGRLGHSPEIRLWIERDMIFKMRKLQYELLNHGINLLKKNGILIYSTCTLTLEENEHLIRRVLEERNDVEVEEATPKVGIEGFAGLVETQRLYPHIHDTQGFFIAKIRKIK
ncbi:MAG: hypothetical protein DRJ38_02615 [Thermoprotei archaeon]|nr:MAG: hypothetical protein DRJ38_02615 [Thermoprotei archaeon]